MKKRLVALSILLMWISPAYANWDGGTFPEFTEDIELNDVMLGENNSVGGIGESQFIYFQHLLDFIQANLDQEWKDSTSYAQGDSVMYGGTLWVALQATTPSVPPSEGAEWTANILDNTDSQGFDVAQLNGTNLELSLDNDSETTITIDLSPLQDGYEANTDDQQIDQFDLSGTTLRLSIERDGQVLQTVDLSSLQDGYEANTDDQGIDVLSLNGTTLQISLENDGQATYTVDLVSLQDGYEANTDDQGIDTFELSSTTLRISLEGDGQPVYTLDLSPLQDGYEANTDNQTLDVIELSGTDLLISLSGDGEATHSIDLSSLGGGSALTIIDESTTLTTAATQLTFVGGGVTATEPGADGLITITVAAGSAPVDSVNGEVGVVVLDPDHLDDTSTTNKFISASELGEIATNTAKTGVTNEEQNVNADWTGSGDDSEILNKPTTISAQQATDISTNNAKTGITTQQATDISTNNAKVGVTNEEQNVQPDWDAVGGDAFIQNKPTTISAQQATDISTNNAKTGVTNEEQNVNADWTGSGDDSEILNKPTIPSTPGEVGAEPADTTIIKEAELALTIGDPGSDTAAPSEQAVREEFDTHEGLPNIHHTPPTTSTLGLDNVENTTHSTDPHTMTIDGRDVSADGTKLDGIDSGADVNRTMDAVPTNGNTGNSVSSDGVFDAVNLKADAAGNATDVEVQTKYLSGTEYDLYGTFLNPQGVYDNDATNHAFTIVLETPAAFTITRIYVVCDSDPTTEITLTFQHKAVGVGYGTPTTIEAVTTTAGVADITSGIDDDTIPVDRKIFVTLSDPDDALTEVSFQIEGDFD